MVVSHPRLYGEVGLGSLRPQVHMSPAATGMCLRLRLSSFMSLPACAVDNCSHGALHSMALVIIKGSMGHRLTALLYTVASAPPPRHRFGPPPPMTCHMSSKTDVQNCDSTCQTRNRNRLTIGACKAGRRGNTSDRHSTLIHLLVHCSNYHLPSKLPVPQTLSMLVGLTPPPCRWPMAASAVRSVNTEEKGIPTVTILDYSWLVSPTCVQACQIQLCLLATRAGCPKQCDGIVQVWKCRHPETTTRRATAPG
jgi:hypothetical protein